MLRESYSHALNWADKTMSVIRTRQLEACEQRLMQLPSFGLLENTTDAQAEALWRISYDGIEHPASTELHTARTLQAQLLIQLPAEAALLTHPEELLVERLLIQGGNADLVDWDEVDAAESLVRRLWCTVSRQEERLVLHMPEDLLTPVMLIMSSQPHQEIRRKMASATGYIQAMLYVHGLMRGDQALSILTDEVLSGTYAADEALALRYLRNAFDYAYDDQGDMLLLHPGLADPDRILHGGHAVHLPDTEILGDQNTLSMAAGGMLPQEQSLFDRMNGLLQQAVRPELSEADAVEDLRMLAKQGVSLDHMQEVLASLLIVEPTRAMAEGVRLIHDFTPRWGSLRTGVVQ